MALQTGRKYQLVDPTTRPVAARFTRAPRVKELRGSKVGLIDDSKSNGKELLEELADLLKTRYGISGVSYHRKPSASKPADPEIIVQMGRECDCAIVAIGD